MERHRFDILSFVFGVIFLGVAATALVDDLDIPAFEARWVWPSVLIIIGLVVLTGTARRADPYDGNELESPASAVESGDALTQNGSIDLAD